MNNLKSITHLFSLVQKAIKLSFKDIRKSISRLLYKLIYKITILKNSNFLQLKMYVKDTLLARNWAKELLEKCSNVF